MNRLTGLEIDEISTVDRPANQHGLVAITKRDTTGDPMGTGLYDETGRELDEAELQPGMVVLDENQEPRVLLDEETAEALAAEGVDLEDTDDILAALGVEIPDDPSGLDAYEEEPQSELAAVGKAAPAWVTGGAHTALPATATPPASSAGTSTRPPGRRRAAVRWPPRAARSPAASPAWPSAPARSATAPATVAAATPSARAWVRAC